MVFLTEAEDKDNFKQDYLQLLSADPKNPEALRTLTALSVSDPANLPHLKSFYQQHYSAREPFSEYWEKEMDKAFTLAPDFRLVQLNKASFSLEAHKGRWVLIDFWGTWCSPCLEEMPRIQSFYREVILKHADKISLLTIACKDTEPKVSTYLNKNRYNFPAALSDGTVEKAYALTDYPTKILVTPNGKQIIIPAGEDWVEKVKGYCQF
jgi:thiol-disulfide isomerase/thioredoxin